MSSPVIEITLDNIADIEKAGRAKLYPETRMRISVGMASCGLATGAGRLYKALEDRISEKSLDVMLVSTGCPGFCQLEPLVMVYRPGKSKLVYSALTPEQAVEMMDAFVDGRDYNDGAVCRLEEEHLIVLDDTVELGRNGADTEAFPLMSEIPFFSKQKKIVLRNCGYIDPSDVEEYIGRGGYSALTKVLSSMSPEDVIEEMKKSGLRGRGGAGFPTGMKWEFCRKSEGERKFVICNADEGDPGAYMDRSVLEGDPHSVIEGMLIGAYAIGAQNGIMYVRSEYPLAIERLKYAIAQAEECGLLGDNVMGKDFSFRIEIRQGAGAFVCGEETSLIASIEGDRPEPRPRPPFPAQSGVWGCPTNINNVETWPNVAAIIKRGADWFAGIGTEKSKGTKVFSLVGAVKDTGLVEVPMGTTLREIVFEMGGGIKDGKELKAIQTGGPSGGCIPAENIDMPVDYEKLAEVGSIMGSGGMVVMDDGNCMVDIAKYFTSFTREESCGKCTSCRDGLDAAYQVLSRITEGKTREGDVALLEELSNAIADASQCGLGKTAPNPIVSTLRFFRSEYDEHINNHNCPAKVCKALINYSITDKCVGCGKCIKSCNYSAIEGEPKGQHRISEDKCVKCGACMAVCPFDAVEKI